MSTTTGERLVIESDRLLAHPHEDDIPPKFWRRVQNIGGGDSRRVSYLDYLDGVFGTLQIGAIPRLTERSWLA